jgi:hypothetical protein
LREYTEDEITAAALAVHNGTVRFKKPN